MQRFSTVTFELVEGYGKLLSKLIDQCKVIIIGFVKCELQGVIEIMQKRSKQLKAMSPDTVKSLIETRHAIPSHISVSAKTTEINNQQVLQKIKFNSLHLGNALSDGYVKCVSESVALVTSRLTDELLHHLVKFTESVLVNNNLAERKATSTIVADYSFDPRKMEGSLGGKEPAEIKISLSLPVGKECKRKSENMSGILSFLQMALPFAEWCHAGEVLAVVSSEGVWRLDFTFNYDIKILAHNLGHSDELLMHCQDEEVTPVMQSWLRQINRLKSIGDTSQRTEYKFIVQGGQLIDADDSIHTCERVDFRRQKIGIW